MTGHSGHCRRPVLLIFVLSASGVWEGLVLTICYNRGQLSQTVMGGKDEARRIEGTVLAGDRTQGGAL